MENNFHTNRRAIVSTDRNIFISIPKLVNIKTRKTTPN